MDSKNIKPILLAALENELPSSQIQIWPTVESSLVAGKHPLMQQGENMNTIKSRRISRMALAALVIVALLVLVLITPQGRAFAQSILRFFIRTDSDTLVLPTQSITWVEVTPGVPHPTMTPQPTLTPLVEFAKDCGSFPIMKCSVEQIRSKVDFTVKEPAAIPDGMYFTGATGGSDGIFLRYEYENNSGGLFISEERWVGPLEGASIVGTSANVEEVQVGNLTGEYFRGIFVQKDGESFATWEPDESIETLRWVENGIAYTLQYSFTYQGVLEKDGLIAIAENMTTERVAKLPMPATATPASETWYVGGLFSRSIPDVEKIVGFKLSLPSQLPEFLSLFGARYDEENKTAIVYFHLVTEWTEPYDNGLFLSQQVISNPNDCTICDMVVGDSTALEQQDGPMIVGANSNLETVQVGDVAGKYVEGVWEGTDCCGWVWQPDAGLKTLRWQVNDRAFELQYLGSDLNKHDLIKIAESLQ